VIGRHRRLVAGATLALLVASLVPAATASAAAASVAVGDASITEPTGKSGTATVEVPVTVTPSATTAVTVDWQTVANTATTADFVNARGTLTIAANAPGGTIAIEIRADKTTEPLRLKILPANGATVDILRLRTASGSNLLSIYYDSHRHLGYRNDTRNQAHDSSTALNLNVWYQVEVHLVVNGASSQVQVWLNGSLITALSRTDNFGTTPIGQALAGESTTGRPYDFALDEVWVDTNP
jgi:hypothetical protein